MNKGKICKLISALLIFTSISLFPYKGYAATLNETYESNINVGLTTLGNISDFKFTVNGNYQLNGSQTILKPGCNYELTINNGSLTLMENGTTIASSNQDMTITSSTAGTLIASTTNKKTYLGSMKFAIKTSTAFFVINYLNIEDYLKGVVPNEAIDSWGSSGGQEALKAQAVVSRTYALYNKGAHGSYDVRDDVASQVYNGYGSELANSNRAIDATKGQVLTNNADGKLINALFCASDGGYTEDPNNVWTSSTPTPYPYLTAKQDKFDAQNSNYAYYSTITAYSESQLENLIRQYYPSWNIKQFVKIDIDAISRFESGRISELPIVFIDNNNITQTKKIIKDDVRGFLNIRSTLSTINYQQNGTIAKFTKYIGGIDRYGTSMNISNCTFNPSSTNKLQNVVLATGNDFPDALSGAVLAKKYNAPILLVDGNSSSTTSSQVLSYINSYLNKSGTIFFLGGTGAIPDSYKTKLNQLGFSNITRLGGLSRIDTSAAINDNIAPTVNTPVVIATANDFPDALSISPIAAAKGWPIYLVDNSISSSLNNYLTTNKPSNVYVVGGTGVVSEALRNQVKTILGYGDDKVIRLGGVNRYDTSKIINSYFVTTTNKVLLATGITFPDALSGSVYAALNNYPIILADSDDSQNAAAYVKAISNNTLTVQMEALGLSGAVSQNTVVSITSIPKYNYVVNSKGFGHGVGMSQWGAYYRAKNGDDYNKILNFYYDNVNIQTLQ